MSDGFLVLVLLYAGIATAAGMTALAVLTAAARRRRSKRWQTYAAAIGGSAIVAAFWPVWFIYLLCETD